MARSVPSQSGSRSVGVARVAVTDNGETIHRDAITLPAGKALTELRIPLEYGWLFLSHNLEIVVTFDPPVSP